ncbi:MAG: hypothetical protein GWM92_14275 [Gemmatimonadetes bacterium]|nr:hypothetical protein [Gemmatimonadota bacterium]NIR79906.1 hypothetical protein [Gemmatimonadota bacterium]NIT88625.1 hypothetical protein [Gemmatimonadota bacterium]NIU32440.1 hypothetical protein [Gemmatimonadota bacterium]NIU36936.1 hypothetical protein [Gemmatimonadota bacterium]
MADPRTDVPPSARSARLDALLSAGAWYALAERAEGRLQDARSAVEGVLRNLGSDDPGLRKGGEALADTLSALRDTLFTGPECQGICGGETPFDAVRETFFVLSSGSGAPSPNDRAYVERARSALERIVDGVNAVHQGPVAAYRSALDAAGYTPFPEEEPLRIGDAGGRE